MSHVLSVIPTTLSTRSHSIVSDNSAPMQNGWSGESKIIEERLEQPDRAMGKPDIPPAVRMALLVILNHVESGFENCKTLVQAWVDGRLELEASDGK